MHCPKFLQLHIVCGIIWSSWGPVILPLMNLMVINGAQVLREPGKSGKGLAGWGQGCSEKVGQEMHRLETDSLPETSWRALLRVLNRGWQGHLNP